MRQILILLALTCAPAFCQDGSLSRQFDYNLQQRLRRMNLLKPRPVLKLQVENSVQVCSIPLLNAKPAGNPVHMPELRMPQGAQIASDHMAAKPPAPACAAR